jgi:hypothetical protein
MGLVFQTLALGDGARLIKQSAEESLPRCPTCGCELSEDDLEEGKCPKCGANLEELLQEALKAVRAGLGKGVRAIRGSPLLRRMFDSLSGSHPVEAAQVKGVIAQAIEKAASGGLRKGGPKFKTGDLVRHPRLGISGPVASISSDGLSATINLPGGGHCTFPVDQIEAAGDMASLTETWGSHGGYAGEPAVEETQSKVAGFFASQAGQLALAKGIRASNAPRAMGFPLQKSATFKAGDRVRHVPSGKRGKFVAMANATHGHVMHDDGSASLFAVDELEKDEIGGYSGIPALDDQGSGRHVLASGGLLRRARQ